MKKYLGIILLLVSCMSTKVVDEDVSINRIKQKSNITVAKYHVDYWDKANNLYSIRNDSLYFIPVTVENSSSGSYSGGEPFEKSIGIKQKDIIISLLKTACTSEKCLDDKRKKGTSTVKLNINEVATECWLKYDSSCQREIERYLKTI